MVVVVLLIFRVGKCVRTKACSGECPCHACMIFILRYGNYCKLAQSRDSIRDSLRLDGY